MLTIEILYERTLSAASPFERSFIELVYRDIKRFAESPERRNSVYCFPGMHTYYRYRIQMVAELFSLSTCLIGSGGYCMSVVSDNNIAVNMYHYNLLVKEFLATHALDPSYKPYML